MVDQITDLFHTDHKVKTQQVIKSVSHHCGDIEFVGGYVYGHGYPVIREKLHGD
jgi:hypothetical protein